MSLLEAAQPVVSSRDGRTLSVVLCGSFRRDPEGLRLIHHELETRFNLLSPLAVDFVDPDAEFVRLPSEVGRPEIDIEDRHIAALRTADLMWLHAPEGYVGASAAMELGEAVAVGIPIFCLTPPADTVLAARVTVVSQIDDLTSSLVETVGRPGKALSRLQHYYESVARRRGWSNESASDTVLLLTEELGELARAVRKLDGIARHHPDKAADVGAELADMQLYLVHLANGLGLDLSNAVTDKERVNARRFEQSRVA
jgi:NTP pyrophosphatase (non-canonical NTP hydrolase)